MKNIQFLTFLLIFSPLHLSAQNTPSAETYTQEVMNNVSDEYSTCVAYFYIAKEAVERTAGSSETSAAYKTAAENAMGFAYIALVESGKTDETAQEVVTSRVDLAMDEMTNNINSDISNVSILLSEYMDRCRKAMNEPEWLMQYWTDKIGEKYGIIPISKDDAMEVRSQYKNLVNDPIYKEHFVQVASEKGLSTEESNKYSDRMMNAGNQIINQTSDMNLGKYMSKDGGERLGLEAALACTHLLKPSDETNQTK